MENLGDIIKLLGQLSAKPDSTQRELVQKLNISLGKVNFLIKALSKRGLIKIKRFKNSDNKMGYLYLLTPKGIKEKTEMMKKFLKEKIDNYERLEQEIYSIKKEVSLYSNKK